MVLEILNYLNVVALILAPIFYKLLFMSIGAVIIGFVIILIRQFADKKISPFWKYLLWMLVLIALIVPYRPNTQFSAFRSASGIEDISFRADYNNISNKVFLADQDEKISKEEFSTLSEREEEIYNKSLLFDVAIPLIWFFVMMLFMGFLVIGKLSLMKSIKDSTLAKNVDYKRIDTIFNNCKKTLDIQGNIKIIIQSSLTSPAIVGALNPMIILPIYVYEMNDESISNIIYHELAHYKRKDTYVNNILLLLQAVYWYNPVVWILLKYIREDMEVLTDSYVINNVTSIDSRSYSASLVEVLGRVNHIKLMPKMLCMVDGKNNTKRRIDMIKLSEKFKKKRIIVSIVSIIIVILLSVLFLTKTTQHEINIYLSSDEDLTKSSGSLEGMVPAVNTKDINAYNIECNMLFLDKEVPYFNLNSYVITIDGDVVSRGNSDFINVDVEGLTLDFSNKEEEEKFESALSDMGLNTNKVFHLEVLDGKELELDAKKLWNYKVDNISSKADLEKLIAYLSFPNGVTYESYSVHDNKLIIQLKSKLEVSKYYSKRSNQENFRQNGFLLLSLVKDIHAVEFVLNNNKAMVYLDKPSNPKSFAEFYRINSKETWSFRKNNSYQNSGMILYVWKNDAGETTYSMLWGAVNRHSKNEIYDENNYTTDIQAVKKSLNEYKDQGSITVVQTDKGDYSEEELEEIAFSILKDKELKIKDIGVDTTKVNLEN